MQANGDSAIDLGMCLGGDEGTRTLNPCLAKAVLYQLSYVPRLGPRGTGPSGILRGEP